MKAMSKITLDALALAVSGTRSEQGYAFINREAADKLVENGLVEVNADLIEGDTIAARATDAGLAHPSVTTDGVDDTNTANGTEAENAANAAVAAQVVSGVISGIEMPSVKRSGGGGRRAQPEKYEFSKMEEGHSFFVADKEDGTPATKTLASTVSGANERYSEVVEGQTRKNRNGKEVPVRRALRRFVVRAVADGGPWGFPGVSGAGVWRVPVEEGTETEQDAAE